MSYPCFTGSWAAETELYQATVQARDEPLLETEIKFRDLIGGGRKHKIMINHNCLIVVEPHWERSPSVSQLGLSNSETEESSAPEGLSSSVSVSDAGRTGSRPQAEVRC